MTTLRIPRLVVMAPLAFVITFLLFLGMRALIEGAYRTSEALEGPRLGDFIRIPTDSVLQEKKRELPKKQPPPKQPPPPQLSTLATGNPQKIEAPKNAFAGPMQMQMDFSPISSVSAGAGPSDSDATPVVRVQPLWPRRAQERGIEGYVVVKFKVGTAGQVVDPEITESKPPGMFDREALKAVRKWKYKPKVVDGKPLEYRVTPVRLDFKFDG